MTHVSAFGSAASKPCCNETVSLVEVSAFEVAGVVQW